MSQAPNVLISPQLLTPDSTVYTTAPQSTRSTALRLVTSALLRAGQAEATPIPSSPNDKRENEGSTEISESSGSLIRGLPEVSTRAGDGDEDGTRERVEVEVDRRFQGSE